MYSQVWYYPIIHMKWKMSNSLHSLTCFLSFATKLVSYHGLCWAKLNLNTSKLYNVFNIFSFHSQGKGSFHKCIGINYNKLLHDSTFHNGNLRVRYTVPQQGITLSGYLAVMDELTTLAVVAHPRSACRPGVSTSFYVELCSAEGIEAAPGQQIDIISR